MPRLSIAPDDECGELSPAGYSCTLEPGHGGPHKAEAYTSRSGFDGHVRTRVVDSWHAMPAMPRDRP